MKAAVWNATELQTTMTATGHRHIGGRANSGPLRNLCFRLCWLLPGFGVHRLLVAPHIAACRPETSSGARGILVYV